MFCKVWSSHQLEGTSVFGDLCSSLDLQCSGFWGTAEEAIMLCYTCVIRSIHWCFHGICVVPGTHTIFLACQILYKKEGQKSRFYLGHSEWVNTSTVRLLSMPLYTHTCAWTTTAVSFPLVIHNDRHNKRSHWIINMWSFRHHHMQNEVLIFNNQILSCCWRGVVIDG